VHARLARRRDVVQRRRALGHRLGNLLRERAGATSRAARATGSRRTCGSPRTSRCDQDEEDELPLSPPYRRALQLAARSHLARVAADLELDLLFVEDGVGERGASGACSRCSSSTTDLFGARPCRDERHFVGLRGVARADPRGRSRSPAAARELIPSPSTRTSAARASCTCSSNRGDPGERVELPLDRDRLPAAPRPAPALL
jgi:hypothetical protein